MNKTCARCEKTVYPTEELKCLDKVWHKGCFKCQECGMTLNMRTYKGYGKLPYCESHVPKAKHTTMAETPELKRIAENTKLQSNVKYHADFEKSKGKFTQVADDPETLRIKANTKIISNVAYHGDLEKKAHMERQRLINENGELVEVPPPDNYHQQIENYATEMLSSQPTPNLPQKTHYQTPTAQPQYYKPPQKYDNDYYQPPPPQHNNYSTNYNNPPQSQHYAPTNSAHPSNNSVHSANNAMHQSHNPVHQISNSVHPGNNSVHQGNNSIHPGNNSVHPSNNSIHAGNNSVHPGNNSVHPGNNSVHQSQKYDDYSYANYGQYQQQGYGVGSQKIGRIQDYDPLSDGPRAPPSTQRASTTLIYNSTNDARQKGSNQPIQQQNRSIGRVADLDPVSEDQQQRAPPVTSNQRVYIAMYDYEANDSDEVSFREGDLISNVTSIDSGWMTGQVLRTGRSGMLPANYVEPAPALYAA